MDQPVIRILPVGRVLSPGQLGRQSRFLCSQVIIALIIPFFGKGQRLEIIPGLASQIRKSADRVLSDINTLANYVRESDYCCYHRSFNVYSSA